MLVSYTQSSLLAKAQEHGIFRLTTINLRDYATGPHAQTDDRPFGGGPGMVLKVEPIYQAVRAARGRSRRSTRVVLFSTRGTLFTQAVAQRLGTYDHLIFICGRYEGVDERVAEHIADEEISMGPYVLSGAELPALTVLDAVVRLRPGFMHSPDSLEDVKGTYPVYTRPEVFTPPRTTEQWSVPDALRSGNHAAIAAWRARWQKIDPTT